LYAVIDEGVKARRMEGAVGRSSQQELRTGVFQKGQ